MPTITDINSSSFWEQKSSLFGLLNYSITTAEKRLAAITGGRDTISANSGYMVFDTLLNGTLVERMRVTSAGKVGIGTTNPAWTLDVTGDINASGSLRLNGAALSTAGNFWAAGSGGAIYYNGGNVGIGTTNPQVLLDLPGYSPSNSAVRFGTMEFQTLTLNNGWWADNVFYNGSVYIYRNTGYGSVLTHANGNFYFSTAPSGTAAGTATITEQFRIGPSGLIKILNLPSVNPGAGTKQLWYDPADSNRIKYAA